MPYLYNNRVYIIYTTTKRDLEIRGAGNILGKKQSGAVNQVGLNLYCQILNEAIERLQTAKETDL